MLQFTQGVFLRFYLKNYQTGSLDNKNLDVHSPFMFSLSDTGNKMRFTLHDGDFKTYFITVQIIITSSNVFNIVFLNTVCLM